MAEKHVAYGLAAGTTAAVIQRIYEFIASGLTQASFVLDGATPAVSIDGVNYGLPVDHTSWQNNSYMVLQIGTAQLLIKRTLATQIQWQFAPDGGWDHATKSFPVTVCRTAASNWLNRTPGAAEQVWLSTGTGDGYSYFRALIYNSAGLEDAKYPEGGYAGGYLACETADTNPQVMLLGKPISGNLAGNWGHINVANLSRSPTEAAHSTLDLAATGQVNAFSPLQYVNGPHLSRDGRAVNLSVLLVTAGSVILGSFGANTMVGGFLTRTDGAVSNPAGYVVVADFLMRWAP